MEIVSEPDIRTAAEAGEFLRKLQASTHKVVEKKRDLIFLVLQKEEEEEGKFEI